MKRNQRKNSKTLFLIIISILSLLFYIVTITINDFEIYNKDYVENEFNYDDLSILDILHENFYENSFENSQMIEITNFLEDLINHQENIFSIFYFTTSCITLELYGIFRNISIKRKPKESNSLKIDEITVNEKEMKIFNLVQEYLDQNRAFDKESVVAFIKSRSRTNGNLNYNGIRIVIDSLLKKKLILEDSKFTRKTLLLNVNRELIYNKVKECPGIYMNKLSKMLNLSPFVIKWHLSLLLKFNLIRKQNLNNKTSYFEFSLDKENDAFFQTISRDKCMKIIKLLKKNKKSYTKSQMAKALHMHYNTITKYLNEIDKFELLIKSKIKNKEYFNLKKSDFKKLINAL